MIERSLHRTKTELSEFLIRHRNKLTPADVGLPDNGRRRTPGLRREEVAALAGVGLTWYTWFEQGRDIQVSEKFLLNIAYTLKLDDTECSHLFLLAHKRPPPPEANHWLTVSPLIQQLMDDLVTRPAYVINLRWDVIAWNAAADDLFEFSSQEHERRNILRMVFADPDMRWRFCAWREDAPKLLAQFRYDFAMAPDDSSMLALVDSLTQLSPDFRRWWQASGNEPARRAMRSIMTANNTCQNFRHETLVVDEHRHLKMVMYFADQTQR